MWRVPPDSLVPLLLREMFMHVRVHKTILSRPVLFAGICCIMHHVNLLLKLVLFYGLVDFALLIF